MSSGWILWVGPVYPVTSDDFQLVRDGGIGEFRRSLILFIGSLCIEGTKLFVGGGIGCVRIFLMAQA